MTASRDTANDDPSLPELLASGSREGLHRLSHQYSERLRRFLSPMLDDGGQVDDVIQEVFMRAFKSAQSLGGWNSSFSAWLFRIARNVAIDQIRSRAVHERAIIAIKKKISHLVVESPLESLLNREFREVLEAKLRDLPETYREAFLLREFEQLDYEEIAVVTGTNAKTVSTRLYRARRLLRTSLSTWLEDDS